MEPQEIIQYLLMIPAALLSLAVHEFSHGYIAYRLGDPTARSLGRLTLDPFKHLDPIGTVCMVLFRFGWAKPVPINPRYFKDPRKGMALTAAAGPISSFLLAFLAAILYRLTLLGMGAAIGAWSHPAVYYFFIYLAQFFLLLHYLNLSLCIFNLIPLPPLDGSRIFYVFLPPKWYFGVMKHERTIQLILLVALWLGAFSGVLGSIVDWLSSLIFSLLALLPF